MNAEQISPEEQLYNAQKDLPDVKFNIAHMISSIAIAASDFGKRLQLELKGIGEKAESQIERDNADRLTSQVHEATEKTFNAIRTAFEQANPSEAVHKALVAMDENEGVRNGLNRLDDETRKIFKEEGKAIFSMLEQLRDEQARLTRLNEVIAESTPKLDAVTRAKRSGPGELSR